MLGVVEPRRGVRGAQAIKKKRKEQSGAVTMSNTQSLHSKKNGNLTEKGCLSSIHFLLL